MKGKSKPGTKSHEGEHDDTVGTESATMCEIPPVRTTFNQKLMVRRIELRCGGFLRWQRPPILEHPLPVTGVLESVDVVLKRVHYLLHTVLFDTQAKPTGIIQRCDSSQKASWHTRQLVIRAIVRSPGSHTVTQVTRQDYSPVAVGWIRKEKRRLQRWAQGTLRFELSS